MAFYAKIVFILQQIRPDRDKMYLLYLFVLYICILKWPPRSYMVYLIFCALDSAVVEVQKCLARMEAFKLLQCIIMKQHSNQINTL